MGMTTTAIIGAITAVAGTAVGVASSVEQSNAQRAQAEYQSDMAKYNAEIAEINAERAEDAGKELQKQAYDEASRKKQETALLIGQQRAKQAASGAQVDQGSSLDLTLDTAEKGTLDAFKITQQGAWQDYNKRIEAWNYRQQAGEHMADAQFITTQAQQKENTNFLKSGNTILSGVKNNSSAIGKLL